MLKRTRFRVVRMWQFVPFTVFFLGTSLGMDTAQGFIAFLIYGGIFLCFFIPSIRYGRLFALANYVWLGIFLAAIAWSVFDQFGGAASAVQGIMVFSSFVSLLIFVGVLLELKWG